MSAIIIPQQTLPKGGQVSRPALDDLQSKVASFATSPGDAREEAAAWAGATHDAENAALRHACSGLLVTVLDARAFDEELIARFKEEAAGAHVLKRVVTAAKAATPAWFDVVAPLLLVGVLAVIFLTDPNFLGTLVMTAGTLGFIPDTPDELVATSIAALPLAMGIVAAFATALWLDRRRQLDMEARLRRMSRHVIAWIVLFSLVFGPDLVIGGKPALMPSTNPDWADQVITFLGQVLRVLDAMGDPLMIVFIGITFYGGHNMICLAILTHRERLSLSRTEEAREGEVLVATREKLKQLYAASLETEHSVALLRGILDRLDHDRSAFVQEVASLLDRILHRAETARRSDVEAHIGSGRVVEAGPLFTRR